ncbi:hypothetical protein JL720_2786 [Aureococcus anophagefferens]|nr:hypothetical protein JL720_2786 [Aureococcus anophagefferens]
MAPQRLAPLEQTPSQKKRRSTSTSTSTTRRARRTSTTRATKLKARPKHVTGPGYNRNVKLQPLDAGDAPPAPDAPKRVDDLDATLGEAQEWFEEFHEEQKDVQALAERGIIKPNGMDQLAEHMVIVSDLYAVHAKDERAREIKAKQRKKQSFVQKVAGKKPQLKYEEMPANSAPPLATSVRATAALKNYQNRGVGGGGEHGALGVTWRKLRKVRPIRDRKHVDATRPECENIRFEAVLAKRGCCGSGYRPYNDVGVNDPLACACVHILGVSEDQLRLLYKEFGKEDADDSGTISEDEFMALLGATDTGFTRALVHAVVWGWAGCGDSDSKQLTFSDYVLACCTVCTLSRKQLMFLVFELFDGDRSGGIEVAEFRKLDHVVRDLGGALFPDDYAALGDAYDEKNDVERKRGVEGILISFHDQVEQLSRSKVGAPKAATACVRSTGLFDCDFDEENKRYVGKRYGRYGDITGESLMDSELSPRSKKMMGEGAKYADPR